MHGFYIERRTLPLGTIISRDLAQHIFARGAKGSVVVVTERPHDLLSTTKKQWHALIRLVQRERASTLKAARIMELSNQVAWMQRLHFTHKLPEELMEDCVYFASADNLVDCPPICSTLYITSLITTEQLRLITSWLPKNGVVVIYDR